MAALVPLCLLLLQLAACRLLAPTYLQVEKFEQCPDKGDLSTQIKNSYVSQVSYNNIRIFGDVIVRSPVVSPASLKCRLSKCPSKENQDLCEYVYTYKTEKFCDELINPGTIWRPFWSQTSLPRSCPIPLGNYSLNGTALRLGDVADISMFRGYWKVRCTGKSNGGRMWMCALAEFDVRSPAGNAGGKRPRYKNREMH